MKTHAIIRSAARIQRNQRRWTLCRRCRCFHRRGPHVCDVEKSKRRGTRARDVDDGTAHPALRTWCTRRIWLSGVGAALLADLYRMAGDP